MKNNIIKINTKLDSIHNSIINALEYYDHRLLDSVQRILIKSLDEIKDIRILLKKIHDESKENNE